ncbi:MAG: hypothetical protein OXC48_11215, partial [Endozoicomonadaceae bacterium]|nr:hypothetical protein [Endozoicomonadaceae bacterium]
NGSRETLSHDGYEIRLEQQNGWGVNFIYQQGTHLLQSITDDQKNNIILKREQGYLDIVNRNSDGNPVTVHVESHNRNINKIVFMSQHKSVNPTITLHYKNKHLTKIIYPTGLEKTFTFNCTDMLLPIKTESRQSLCVVSTETVVPDIGQIIKTNYFYSHSSTNEHTYIGFNAGLTITKNMKRDILFEAPVNYTYRITKDNGLLKQIYTYNKYHLLIDNKLISDNTGSLLSETETFFCNTQLRDGCAKTSFEELPPTYSFPLKVITKVWSSFSDKPAVTTQSRKYDHFGRVISSTDAYGRITITHYCPLTGDAACPVTPKGLPFTLLPESITFYPTHAVLTEMPVTILNHYRKEFNLNGNSYTLVPDHQIKKSQDKFIQTTFHYYHNIHDVLTYGLTKQTILTGTTDPSLKPESIIHDYYYTKSTDGYQIISRDATELEQGKKQFHYTTSTSLFTNQILSRTDPSGKNKTAYHYDIFGRLIQKDFAAGTPFASTERYQHLFSPGHNQVIITKVNGLQEKIIFDNAGRERMLFKETISASGEAQPGHWQLKKSFHYDAYGRTTEQIFYMQDDMNKIHPLKTIQDYDEIGRIHSILLPDRERKFVLYDDKDRCIVSYRKNYQGKHSAITVVLGDILNKPIERRLIPAFSKAIPPLKTLCSKQSVIPDSSISTITYDSFDRIVKKTDPMGNTVRNQYNALGHLSDTTDPVGNIVHRIYNLSGQVVQLWLFPVTGGHYLLSSSGYNADGQMLFKATEDGKRKTFTYTKNGLPATVKTPSGHTFSWKYNTVDLPVTSYIDDKILMKSDYDPTTRQLIKKTDITGTTIWKYGIDGLPQKLIHTGKNNYSDYKLMWYYDNNRINIGSTDIDGNITKVTHDKFGRTIRINYIPVNGSSHTLYSVVYDNFSRRKSIHYGSGMYRTFHYDEFGRKNKVTDILNNQLISRWKFTYDVDNNIITLNQQEKDHQYAILNYQYDSLDNLTAMHCHGSPGLPLCPRDTAFKGTSIKIAPVITKQHYFFTRLNRLAKVREISQDLATGQTLNKTMVYSYNQVNSPLRLKKISITWNHNVPVTHHFNYDISGNMIIDGEGNHILYNAFNQIIQTTQSDGKQSYYAYDGGGMEVMEETTAIKRYLFYRKKQLINEKIFTENKKIHTIGYQGMARTIDNIINEYEEHNYKGDVVGILTKIESANDTYKLSQRNLYSPYGMVWHAENNSSPFYLQNLNGFDGQRTDPITGWQFLGAGHRTYNPQQRYFVSEDSFGDGYAFCSNNPIMKIDPTGNNANFFYVMNAIGTLGMSLSHKKNKRNKVAKIAGFSIIFASSIFSAIAALIWAEASIVSVFLGTESFLYGIIPLMAGIYDANNNFKIGEKLDEAASVFNVLQIAITIGTTAFIFGPRILRGLSSIRAESALINNRTEYESIGENMSHFAALSSKLRTMHPDLFARENFTDTLKLNSLADVTNVRNTIGLYDEDIGIALTSAYFGKKPLDIEKLETLISAKENIDTDFYGYRLAFRELISDFSTSYRPNTPLRLKNIFPRRVNYAVFVYDNKMAFIIRTSRKIYQRVFFTETETNLTNKRSIKAIMSDFMSDNDKFLVDEYFYF